MAADKKTAFSSSAKAAASSMTLRLSRGRTLKITFRPRIRLANILVKLLAAATGLFTFAVATANAAPPVNALPTGGQVVYGNTSFAQTGNTLNVNQASQSTIINWQSFDIGAQSIVNFNQLNSSAVALNRILGDNASQIYGQLNANGHVFLLNPNGILFAPGSQVNVGGLLASTMRMADGDFIAGNYRLTNAGAGSIDSQGNIYANSIAFVGNNLSNSGNLYATNVSLVAGDTVAVDISGDGLIRARIESPALQAQISNSGNINAVQQVTMSAGQSRDTINSLVNNSGIIRATGLSNEGGVITLQGGKTLNSGVLDVASNTGKGGTAHVLGEHVGIVESGSVIASGATGGGTILVGGDFQGNNTDVFNADRTYIGANTLLNADAINTGNGGKIIVWADDVTRAYGDISARGGAVAGNGGFVEVSGKRSLDYQANTDTSAAHGQFGMLLLDPDNINIVTIGGGNLLDVDQFLDANITTATSTDINTFLINNAPTNITLQAKFDINFNAPINIVGGGIGLTAQAGQNINVNSSITTNGGAVGLIAGDTVASPASLASAINLNANINAGTGQVSLINANSSGSITQAASSIISASNLLVDSVVSVNLVGENNVLGNIAAKITGSGSSFTFNSIDAINVGSVGSIIGITTSNGNASLTSGIQTNLNFNQAIDLGTGNLTLNSLGDQSLNGDINIMADITANNIVATSTVGNINIGDHFTSIFPKIDVHGNATLTATESTTSFAGGIINIFSEIKYIGSGTGSLTASADRNVVLQGGSIIKTTSSGIFNVTLASDTNANGSGIIDLIHDTIDGGVSITTNGGNITLGGGISAAGFASNNFSGAGVNLNTATLNAANTANTAGGNIAIRGAATNNDGVSALDSTIKTAGTGTVAITGNMTGQAGGNGVRLSGSTISAQNGNITITGNAPSVGSTPAAGNGILLDSSFANNATNISTNGTGNIALIGSRVGTGDDTAGIAVTGATVIQTTATGTVSLTGTSTGDASGSGQRGILVSGAGTTIGVTNGALTLDGDASTGASTSNSDGILINGGAIIQSAGAGQVSLIGKSATTGSVQAGIAIADTGTQVRSLTLSSGDIILDGQGNGTGASSFGVVLFNAANIDSSGTGGIDITAKSNTAGGDGASSPGLAIDSGSSIDIKSDFLTIAAGNNNITTGDDQIRLASASGASINNTGTAQLQLNPINNATGIGIGNGSIGVFNLNNNDIAAINDFVSVSIGSNTHTGTYDVASLNSFSSTNNNAKIGLTSNGALMDFSGASGFFGNLEAVTTAGDVAINNSLAATMGAILINSNDDVTISTAGSITASGNIDIVANVDLDTGGTGGGDFINLAGSGALVNSGTGKWKVYSLDVAGNTYGGLLSGNQAIWGTTFTGFLATPGNRYVFAETPTVIVTSTDTTKTYGQNGAPIVANAYSTTGFVNAAALGNVFTQDTAANALSGSATSTGSAVATNVGSYAISMTPITATTGYLLTKNSTGSLTVSPAPLNVTATGINKAFDGTTLANVLLADNRLAGDLLSFTYTANFFDSAIGTGKQIDVIGITLSGADAGNYSLDTTNAIAFADITGTTAAISPLPTAPTSNNGLDESDRTKADTLDKALDLELVLLPVKIKLPTEDEYIIATGASGKELTCK